MYSRQHSCIFVHQRKAAGSSIKTLFSDAVGTFNDGVLDPLWRAGDPRVNTSFRFTVVRNPWDRFISAWKYLNSTRNRDVKDVLLNLPREKLIYNFTSGSPQSRLSYLSELYQRTTSRMKARLISTVSGKALKLPHNQGHDFRHITRQQYATVTEENGRLVVDAVLFLESLDEGLEFLAQEVGIDPSKIVIRNQRRAGDDYRVYFNDSTIDLFQKLFRTDIECWGYDFEAGPGIPPRRSLVSSTYGIPLKDLFHCS